MRKCTLPLLLLLVSSVAAGQTLPESSAPPATLRPGDVVKIEIWREEDLSGEFLVDEAGIITLPLLGEKQVTDVPMRSLRDLLIEEYRVQLRNPSINITPLRRIHLLGEVARPGLYEVDPTITLAAAVALAGGATATGDLNRIRVIRGSEVIRDRVAAGDALSTVDIRSGDQILVDRRSWAERNSLFLISTALNIPTLIVGFIGLLNLIR